MTTTDRPPGSPAPGSRAVPEEIAPDGAPESTGPHAGERAAEHQETTTGPVGPTAVDPTAPGSSGPRSGRSPNGPVMLGAIARMVTLTVDDREVRVPEGATILDALHDEGTPAQADTPTLCWAPNMKPINACRVCVVEVEKSRVLVPSCA